MNGAVLNRGMSFQQLAMSAQGRQSAPVVNVNAAGVFMSAPQLAQMLRDELLKMGRMNVNVGMA